jgi:peptidoglycan-associated lipoprotein
MRREMRSILVGGATLALLLAGCGPDYPNCDNDDDCHQGEYCVNGLCQQCRDDGDCPTGQTCRGGACAPAEGFCQSNGDCPDGQECRNNRCVAMTQAQTDTTRPTSGEGQCELGPVYFGFDQDALDSSARNAIQANVTCMRQRGAGSVHVTGHTDPRGTEEYNLALGDRRARSVVEYMSSLGVDSSTLSSSSMGEEMASGSDEGSWSRDRKATFTAQ